MQKAMGLLSEWGTFVQAHMHHDGFSSINTINRLFMPTGDSWGDSILCLDMPPSLRRVEVAVKGLPNLEQNCVRMWFCSPLRDDNERYTARQLSKLTSGIHSEKKFKDILRYGIKRVERLL